MTRRLSKVQQQQIIREMLDLARFLTSEGVPLPDIVTAVGLLRDDLVKAYRQGITVVQVERNYIAILPKRSNDHEQGDL